MFHLVLIKENQYTTNNSKFRYQGRATPLLLSNTQTKIDGDLFVDVHVKYASSDERFPKSETYRIRDEISNSPDINEFKIVYIKSLGAKFKSSKGFVDIIEQMMVDFYQGVVQNARPWTPPAPRIQKAE